MRNQNRDNNRVFSLNAQAQAPIGIRTYTDRELRKGFSPLQPTDIPLEVYLARKSALRESMRHLEVTED